MQQIRQKQVRGQLSDSLHEDIALIAEELKYFDPPVKTKADLPLDNNEDGNIRVVLDENAVYSWNADKGEWITRHDTYTEAKSTQIILDIDGQTTINTGIKVGMPNGMPSLSSVQLFVNGFLQREGSDYNVSIDTDFNCMLEWISRDFQLEISDAITISYDTLLLS